MLFQTLKNITKIADKLDEQIKNNTKTASIFIIDKTLFLKKKNGLYYKVTFSTIEEYNLDYRNKNNIIAYSKIDFKLGYFSKISYIEDSIEIQDRQLNFYIITAYEIVIQESDIKYFINTIKTRSFDKSIRTKRNLFILN